MDGIRMDERHLETEEPRVRLGVDELGSLALQRLERSMDVRDLERNVVHSRAARGEEPADGRIVLERAEQLDPSAADEDGCGFHALLRDGRPMLELRAEQPRVRAESLVQIGDGDAEMMDAARLHPDDASRAR